VVKPDESLSHIIQKDDQIKQKKKGAQTRNSAFFLSYLDQCLGLYSRPNNQLQGPYFCHVFPKRMAIVNNRAAQVSV